MNSVWLRGEASDVAQVSRTCNDMQNSYPVSGLAAKGAIPVRLVKSVGNGLFRVSRDDGVQVSLRDSASIAEYAQVEREQYLAVLVLLGVLQYRVLQVHSDFNPEDFMHTFCNPCVLYRPRYFGEYADLIGKLQLCPGCKKFYNMLLEQHEVEAVLEAITYTREGGALQPPIA